ncbi:metallo-dependent hydrolase [Fusibacter ferrireducens]|uniref:Metallo-dependent hydrolase n=1 Tax=Fusibacter ferrireducens TaxID=2785058 RepID=A0ABR9ZSN5_9FIRM|nr:metallo-dependent hydrolase [Fusibacter ferrireducens]MBF4693153.1 metallo-dependent hydrolase [Fusibacter ferrireducens]
MVDLIIKNGRVIDPLNGVDKICDVLVQDGKIKSISNFKDVECQKEIDATDCIVTPGLIDFHAHVYPLAEIGIPTEVTCFSSGITTIVDAGSTGCANYESYRGFINTSKVRIKCFLNMSSSGLTSSSSHENIDPQFFNSKKIKWLFDKYPNELLGLKIRFSKEIVDDLGIDPLIKTIELANEIDVPIVVHSTNAPISIDRLVSYLRPGDVLTHAYHGIGNSILDENGKVSSGVKDARARGVIFDVANARFHFAFKTARAALSEGFLPDVISTDLTTKSLYKKPQIFNMMFLLSKYLNMGLDLYEIISRCTSIPADLMGMKGVIGCLSEGACADITIIKCLEREVHFEDWDGDNLTGNRLLKTMLTVKDGQIVFQDIEL